MTDYSDGVLLDRRDTQSVFRFRLVVMLLVPLAAILFQVYVPIFFGYLAYLELPLLVTVYFSLMKRNQIAGTLTGAAIGLAQDSVAVFQHSFPIGMFGIVKTLVGYFASSLTLRFDVDNHFLRFTVALFFYFFHQLMFWVLASALLGHAGGFPFGATALAAVLNAVTAVPLYAILDKLRLRP